MPVSARAEHEWVLFGVDSHRLALPLRSVERVVRAVEVAPLPRAPALILGVVDVAGEILPVFDLRQRLGLDARALHPDQQFLIAKSSRRRLVLVVDEALGVIDAPALHMTAPAAAVAEQVNGMLSLPDGLVLIQDLEKFIGADEERTLDAALREAKVRRGH